jgi:ribosomal protein L22
MTEEPEKPTEDETVEGAEATPSAEAPRSEESASADGPDATRGASAEDAPSRSHGDELADAVDEVATSDDTDAEADAVDETPEPEPVAETDDEEPEAEEADAEVEAEAPKRRRRPSRRRAAASAEDEPEAQVSEEEPEAEEPPAAPAPTRRRARRDPDEPAPVVRAQAKYVRSSARKARLVCDHIRGKSVDEARAILAVTPRAIARDWSKLLESAIANAEHNHELVGEDLYVKAVHADEGPTIKRFRPRAMGRATRIRKRTSHLTILLTPKD